MTFLQAPRKEVVATALPKKEESGEKKGGKRKNSRRRERDEGRQIEGRAASNDILGADCAQRALDEKHNGFCRSAKYHVGIAGLEIQLCRVLGTLPSSDRIAGFLSDRAVCSWPTST